MSSIETDCFIVAEEEAGVRVDRLLADRFVHHSRTYFQRIIEEGFVLVNGRSVKKRLPLEEGDEVEVCFPLLPAESTLTPEAIPLDVLFEDDALIAINKPPGMVVHPAPGHPSGTFVNALLHHCANVAPTGNDPLRPGIVHRLDKDTSGVLIAAKTPFAHQSLVEQFACRTVEKSYLAVCLGRPRNGRISAPIGRHPVHRKEMAVLPDGKEAISDVKVLAHNERYSLVMIQPKTGRTHQIRVHLKHVGAPIVGDPIYGNASLAPRPLLHAYRLTVSHPIHETPVKLSAPIPADLADWIRQLCGPSLCAPDIDPPSRLQQSV
jgi:23S rRNA pseudouridine1911/1915/1917 synthase